MLPPAAGAPEMDLRNFRWLQYNMALALCYAAVAIMAGMQVSRILYYKYSPSLSMV